MCFCSCWRLLKHFIWGHHPQKNQGQFSLLVFVLFCFCFVFVLFCVCFCFVFVLFCVCFCFVFVLFHICFVLFYFYFFLLQKLTFIFFWISLFSLRTFCCPRRGSLRQRSRFGLLNHDHSFIFIFLTIFFGDHWLTWCGQTDLTLPCLHFWRIFANPTNCGNIWVRSTRSTQILQWFCVRIWGMGVLCDVDRNVRFMEHWTWNKAKGQSWCVCVCVREYPERDCFWFC